MDNQMVKEQALKHKLIQLFNYLWDEQTKSILWHWLKVLGSVKGVWFFLPAILGILFVYWAEANGFTKTLLNKGYNETLAIWLMSITTALFLIRTLLYKLEIDIILLAMAANFLCREIHFAGTHKGVYIAAVIIGLWAILWKKRLIKCIEKADLFIGTLSCTGFVYLMAFLIQKRVFKPHRLPLLPNEGNMHIFLEEVLENLAHFSFLTVAIVAFFSIAAKQIKQPAEPTS